MIRELKDTDTYKIYPAYANFILLRILKNGLTSMTYLKPASDKA